MRILAVTNMFPTADDPGFGSFVKSQIESIEEQGVIVDVIFANGRRSKFHYLIGAWQVFWKSLFHRYGLIHAHYGLSGLMARCQFRAPLIVSFCGSDLMDRKQAKISRLVARWADICIVKSHRLKKALGRIDARVIPNGINLSLFHPMDRVAARKMLGLGEKNLYILFVGHPENRPKRYDVAQQTWNIVQKRSEQTVQLIALHDRPQAEVPIYMNACDVLLITSDWEGSPNMVKEAMACNLPIVSTDVGDVEEIISGTINCRICPQDPEILAEQVLTLLEKYQRTDGRARISSFSLEKTAERILRTYGELVHPGVTPVI